MFLKYINDVRISTEIVFVLSLNWAFKTSVCLTSAAHAGVGWYRPRVSVTYLVRSKHSNTQARLFGWVRKLCSTSLSVFVPCGLFSVKGKILYCEIPRWIVAAEESQSGGSAGVLGTKGDNQDERPGALSPGPLSCTLLKQRTVLSDVSHAPCKQVSSSSMPFDNSRCLNSSIAVSTKRNLNMVDIAFGFRSSLQWGWPDRSRCLSLPPHL